MGEIRREVVLQAARKAGYDLVLDEDFKGKHMHEQILEDLIRFVRAYEIEKVLQEADDFLEKWR